MTLHERFESKKQLWNEILQIIHEQERILNEIERAPAAERIRLEEELEDSAKEAIHKLKLLTKK